MPASTIESDKLPPPNSVEYAQLRARARWRTLAQGLAGSLLAFASLPPLELGPLAWLAVVPWLLLVRQTSLVPPIDVGAPRAKRNLWLRPFTWPVDIWRWLDRNASGYRELWIAGFIFWLMTVHWLRYPHPAVYLGWLAISFYLGMYLPVFVGLCRVATRRLGIPLVVAAPVLYMGLELAQAHIMTGFMMGMLGHSQYKFLQLIQISDLFGAYAVSGVVVLVGAAIVMMLPVKELPRWRFWPAIPALLVLGLAVGYGEFRLREQATTPGPTFALIQGSILPEWKADPTRDERIFDEYWSLSTKAVDAAAKAPGVTAKPLDIVVWPETMFREPIYKMADDFVLPPNATMTFEQAQEFTKRTPNRIADLVMALKTPLLLGLDAQDITNERPTMNYNSSVITDRSGKILARYDKVHRVVFGEFIPFADIFPLLYAVTPLSGGIYAGAGPVAFPVGDYIASPSICYETVIPHVIRNQVVELAAQGRKPDVLVNLTNDAWFRGSSELMQHLICGVFRAVETRRPLVVAANGGLSALVDSSGRIVEKTKPLETATLTVTAPLDRRDSLYLAIGDLPIAVCTGFCVFVAGVGMFGRSFGLGRENPRNE